jgi:hypothetical protein
MNTFFNVIVLLSFLALFVYMMYKIMGNTTTSSSSTPSGSPAFDDTPSAAANAEFQKVKFGQGTSLRNMSETMEMVSLRNAVIKSSSNSALTGNYVNLDMIRQVLSRGCRVLDFQVFLKDGAVVVGYSNAIYDPSFSSMTSLNCVSLAGVCTTILSNAFSDTSPNKDDPVFVQLHLKTNATNYDTISEVLYAGLKGKLAWVKDTAKALEVTPDTRLSDVAGKVVLFINAPQLSSYTPTQDMTNTTRTLADVTNTLADVTNMYVGTPTVPIYSEANLLQQMYSPSSTSPYLMRIVQPSLGFFGGVTNPNAPPLISNYSSQIVLEAFYIADENLKTYESLFDAKNSAFLLLTDTIGAIKRSSGK